jgi:glutathione S-transferase
MLQELAPPALSKLGPITRAMTGLGVRYVRKKYDRALSNAALGDMARVLGDAQKALTGRYLLGEFSFADVALCAALQFVEPVAEHLFPIGAASHAKLVEAELSGEYRDVLDWRDRVYAERRGAPALA